MERLKTVFILQHLQWNSLTLLEGVFCLVWCCCIASSGCHCIGSCLLLPQVFVWMVCVWSCRNLSADCSDSADSKPVVISIWTELKICENELWGCCRDLLLSIMSDSLGLCTCYFNCGFACFLSCFCMAPDADNTKIKSNCCIVNFKDSS